MDLYICRQALRRVSDFDGGFINMKDKFPFDEANSVPFSSSLPQVDINRRFWCYIIPCYKIVNQDVLADNSAKSIKLDFQFALRYDFHDSLGNFLGSFYNLQAKDDKESLELYRNSDLNGAISYEDFISCTLDIGALLVDFPLSGYEKDETDGTVARFDLSMSVTRGSFKFDSHGNSFEIKFPDTTRPEQVLEVFIAKFKDIVDTLLLEGDVYYNVINSMPTSFCNTELTDTDEEFYRKFFSKNKHIDHIELKIDSIEAKNFWIEMLVHYFFEYEASVDDIRK